MSYQKETRLADADPLGPLILRASSPSWGLVAGIARTLEVPTADVAQCSRMPNILACQGEGAEK